MLPAGIKVYAVLARDVFPGGSAAGAFYRKLKLGVVEHIAGVGFGGMQWCEEVGCGLEGVCGTDGEAVAGGGMVGALFCGGVFYGPLSGTLVFGVLAAAARGGMVSKGWEKLRDAEAISIYYAVRRVDSILHLLDAIDH